jgi:glycerol-3-phosphate acyltransferase PlsY
VGLIYAAIWIALLLLVRISSVAGMAAAASAPLSAYLLGVPQMVPLLAGFAFLVIWQHRANIVRLRAGTEPRIGRKKA